METERILSEIRSAIRSARGRDVRVALEAGAVILEGEVDSVAVKKRLLARAAAHPAVTGVVDRVRVAPAQRMGDGEIRDRLRDALLAEPALGEVALREVVKGTVVPVREPQGARGDVCLRVEDGVVTLDGCAPSLAHQRLAGVLAWWVPGVRDVINGLDVAAPEADTDDEITDAVRVALEKDPFVDPSQVRVTTHDAAVTLEGLVPKEAEREMAELDAWYVLGVERVDNRIEVRPGRATGVQ